MRNTRRSFLVGGTVALSGCTGLFSNTTGRTVSTCDDQAGGWSQFQGGIDNSGHSAGPAVVPESLDPVNRVADADGGAVFADGSLFFGTGVTLYAYDRADGSRQWSKELGKIKVTPAAYCDVVLAATINDVFALDAADGSVRWESEAPGIMGAVGVSEETVLVPTSGAVHALAITDGTDHWVFDPDWSIRGCCAADGTVFANGGDVTSGFVAAVDLETGEQRWSTRLTRKSYWPAVYHDGSVLAVDDGGTAYRIDADGGEIVWEQRVGEDEAPESLGRQRSVDEDRVPGPLVTDSLVVVGGGNADRTYALDAETGEKRWVLETGPVLAPPAAAGEEIYVGTMNRGVFALDHEGTVQWHREEPNVGSPMAIHDGALVFKSRFPNPQLYRLGP